MAFFFARSTLAKFFWSFFSSPSLLTPELSAVRCKGILQIIRDQYCFTAKLTKFSDLLTCGFSNTSMVLSRCCLKFTLLHGIFIKVWPHHSLLKLYNSSAPSSSLSSHGSAPAYSEEVIMMGNVHAGFSLICVPWWVPGPPTACASEMAWSVVCIAAYPPQQL